MAKHIRPEFPVCTIRAQVYVPGQSVPVDEFVYRTHIDNERRDAGRKIAEAFARGYGVVAWPLLGEQ
ncbi:hypothetical protein [Tistrella sp.]|uniref:hypothetical protein n=1 Tax=Tistrella sp. TaxID=2024861 RepID=UPI0025F58BE0|nr:hypothetical protein [Tistrella sp.]|tara:strand:- start:12026 stop:12226 length:201 start_codon:yes stop_codon:yes gene_type:complete